MAKAPSEMNQHLSRLRASAVEGGLLDFFRSSNSVVMRIGTRDLELKDLHEWEMLWLKRERRIKFVEDHKEQIKQLHQRTNFPPLFPEALSKMKGQSLKEACAIRDLKVTGTKEILRKRLLNPDSNKAKRPHMPRIVFASWLMRAAYKNFDNDDDEYDEIGKFGRGYWAHMDLYREYGDYYAFVVKAGNAFGAFDY